jgi:GNAT superfamily N-acetyltransferase
MRWLKQFFQRLYYSQTSLRSQIRILHLDDLRDGAELALRERLYHPGWQLENRLYEALRAPSKDETILLAEGTYDLMGICYLQYRPHDNKTTICFYVKEIYRRFGVGSTLYREARQRFPEADFVAELGSPGSRQFFEKNNISYSN